MFLITGALYALGAWTIRRWRKSVAWHTHFVIFVFALSVGMNVVTPPPNTNSLYGLVIGLIAGTFWVLLYLAIVGIVKLVRKPPTK